MNCFYTIEIEATNYCNAHCEFCAHESSAREKGYIDLNKFKSFISRQKEIAKNNILNHVSAKEFTPKIVFGGLGEPLLHKEICELISTAKANGFYVSLISNGSLLTKNMAVRLAESGLDELDISLHTVNPQKYHSITGMNLKLFISSLAQGIQSFIARKKKVQLWRIAARQEEMQESPTDSEEYNLFCKQCGISEDSVLGPSLAWSRDGIVESVCGKVNDDFFWCNKIPFTFNIAWDGTVVLCCNDYNRESVELGNAFDVAFSFSSYFRTKKAILDKTYLPSICKECRRWKDNEIENIANIYDINLEELWEKLKLV